MNLTVFVGLVAQVGALWLLRTRLGGGWLRHPFTLLVLTGVTYHGVSEVILRLGGNAAWSPVRRVVDQASLDTAVMWVSFGLFALVVGYVATRPAPPNEVTPAQRRRIAQAIDWRLFAVLALPLIAATAAGRGYAGATDQGSWVKQFLLPVIVLASFGFIVRYGPRWFIPVVVAQTVILTVTGQRLEIFITAAMLALMLTQAGYTPKRRHVVVMMVVAGLLAVAVTSVRTTQGRAVYQADTGLGERLTAVKDALLNPVRDDATGPGLLAQAALRFDANGFAGLVQQRFDAGADPLGVGVLAGSVSQSLPSAIYPEKLSVAVYDRDPETAAIERLRIPELDYVPGFVGIYLPAVGGWLLLPLMLALGWLYGRFERIILRKTTPVRLVALGLLVEASLFYERGLPGFLIQLRAAIPLCLLVWLLSRAAGARTESLDRDDVEDHRRARGKRNSGVQ